MPIRPDYLGNRTSRSQSTENPRNMVASRTERKTERQSKNFSACSVLTPAGTRRKSREAEGLCGMWVQVPRVDGMGAYQYQYRPPWLPPTGSPRLVSSRRHRPLPTFPLPFPAGSRFQQTQRPRKTQSLRDQSRILPIGGLSSSVSSGCW